MIAYHLGYNFPLLYESNEFALLVALRSHLFGNREEVLLGLGYE